MRAKLLYLLLLISSVTMAQEKNFTQTTPDHDIINVNGKNIELWFIGHASLMMKFEDYVVYIDPVAEMGNYSQMPKADLILVTHHHSDHLDLPAIKLITKENTRVICNALSLDKLPDAAAMKNGSEMKVENLTIKAVPAYNILHQRAPGKPFHPKGEGNGYIITFENKKIYVGGDTENIPEMAELKDIFIAFLPMNLPYTMTPEMVAEVAKTVKPVFLYPYHYGSTNTNLLLPLVDSKTTEVRIRELK